jgi:hypothetical protein
MIKYMTLLNMLLVSCRATCLFHPRHGEGRDVFAYPASQSGIGENGLKQHGNLISACAFFRSNYQSSSLHY